MVMSTYVVLHFLNNEITIRGASVILLFPLTCVCSADQGCETPRRWLSSLTASLFGVGRPSELLPANQSAFKSESILKKSKSAEMETSPPRLRHTSPHTNFSDAKEVLPPSYNTSLQPTRRPGKFLHFAIVHQPASTVRESLSELRRRYVHVYERLDGSSFICGRSAVGVRVVSPTCSHGWQGVSSGRGT